MSAVPFSRDRLVQLMIAEGVQVPPPGLFRYHFNFEGQREKIQRLFAKIKSESGLNDDQLMQRVCYYSRARKMQGSDKVFCRNADGCDYTVSFLLRMASSVMLSTQPAYLNLLLDNAEGKELRKEISVCFQNKPVSIGGLNHHQCRLYATALIADFMRFGGFSSSNKSPKDVQVFLNGVLTQYLKNGGRRLLNANYNAFKRVADHDLKDMNEFMELFIVAISQLLERGLGTKFYTLMLKMGFPTRLKLYSNYGDDAFRNPGPSFHYGSVDGKRVFDSRVVKSLPLTTVASPQSDKASQLIRLGVDRSTRPVPLRETLTVGKNFLTEEMFAPVAAAGGAASGGASGAAAGAGGPSATLPPPPPPPSAPELPGGKLPADHATGHAAGAGGPRPSAPFAEVATESRNPVAEKAAALKANYQYLVDSIKAQNGADCLGDHEGHLAVLLSDLGDMAAGSDTRDISSLVAFHQAVVKPHIQGLLEDKSFNSAVLSRIVKDIQSIQSHFEASQTLGTHRDS